MITVYATDSFFTLSVAEQAGLLLLSAGLAAVSIVVAWRGAQRYGFVVRLAVALAIYWLFLWLSPQTYYLYYTIIFPSLPAQIILGWPPTPGHVFNLLTFQTQHNLSFHGQGVLGWVLIVMALVQPSARKRA
ncbi:MAG: hypothetical protein ACR2O8_05050 [Rhizobiaceae bacterium]